MEELEEIEELEELEELEGMEDSIGESFLSNYCLTASSSWILLFCLRLGEKRRIQFE